MLNPAIPVIVTNTSLGIVNSKLVKHGGSASVGADKNDKAESFLNTTSVERPVRVKSYSTTSQVTMTANPRYWGTKRHFSTVVLRNVAAPAQLLDAQRGRNEDRTRPIACSGRTG